MSFWNQVKQLIPFATVNNWSIWTMHCTKNDQHTLQDTEKWFCNTTTTNHTQRKRSDTISALSWKLLLYSPYSPDLALPDYHLFSSMSHALSMKHFNNYGDVEKRLDDCTEKTVYVAEKTIQNFSSAKYLSWLYDIGIVAKLNAWRTEMRILPSYHYNFVRATIEVQPFNLYR